MRRFRRNVDAAVFLSFVDHYYTTAGCSRPFFTSLLPDLLEGKCSAHQQTRVGWRRESDPFTLTTFGRVDAPQSINKYELCFSYYLNTNIQSSPISTFEKLSDEAQKSTDNNAQQ